MMTSQQPVHTPSAAGLHGALMAHDRAISWRTHGALMAQTVAKTGGEGLGCDLCAMKAPLGAFHGAKNRPQANPGRSRFMAHSWRTHGADFMARIRDKALERPGAVVTDRGA